MNPETVLNSIWLNVASRQQLRWKSTIHWMNYYPADKCHDMKVIYPLDSLSLLEEGVKLWSTSTFYVSAMVFIFFLLKRKQYVYQYLLLLTKVSNSFVKITGQPYAYCQTFRDTRFIKQQNLSRKLGEYCLHKLTIVNKYNPKKIVWAIYADVTRTNFPLLKVENWYLPVQLHKEKFQSLL